MCSFEQKREVNQWLESLFAGEKIPEFDNTDEELIQELYKMQQHCKETERDIKVKTDFQKLQIVEYQNETERMNKIMEDVGMSSVGRPSLEDEPLEELIRTMADVAQLLGVDNPSEDDLDLALANLRLRSSDTHVFELKRQQKIEKEKQERLESINRLSHSECALDHENKEAKHQKETLNNSRKKTAFMLEKLQEYGKTAEMHKSVTKKNGFKKEILHENILNLKKDLDELEANELKPKQIKLAGYNGLPPSLELAKAKVAEAEHELESLQHELTKEITALHV